MSSEKLLESYIRLIAERSAKAALLSGDRSSEWGSDEHVSDLESRLADAEYWKGKYPKGSEKRSRYRDICSHLKRELHSAKKKQQLREKQKMEQE